MPTTTPLEALEIIGYADALDAGDWPVVVPPVFRFKDEADSILAPPFKLDGEHVIGGSMESHQCFLDWERNGRVTRITARPARPEHELWVDLDGNPQYEPSPQVWQQLRQMAKDFVVEAENALQRGDLPGAEERAQRAANADERNLNALAIQVAGCEIQKKFSESRFLRELLPPEQPTGDLNDLVDRYLKMYVPTTRMRDTATIHAREAAVSLFARAC
jgi:hypothetical protein